MTMIYRELKTNEYDLLKEFLYEAIFIPPGVEPPDRSIVKQPELALYYEGFGTGRADHCIVAEDAGKVIGAVWTRIMNDYGHVDDDTPSLAISIIRDYRGQGISTQLMKKMLLHLKKCGFGKASLAVQKKNYAVRMYEKVGFKVTDENAEEFIMICDLQELGVIKTLKAPDSVNAERMTAGQIRDMIQNGLEDVESGRFRDLDELMRSR